VRRANGTTWDVKVKLLPLTAVATDNNGTARAGKSDRAVSRAARMRGADAYLGDTTLVATSALLVVETVPKMPTLVPTFRSPHPFGGCAHAARSGTVGRAADPGRTW
jgi:hypothetical protein